MVAIMEAHYIGKDNNGFYRVNVKNTNPAGKFGDAGVIRVFESKEEAEEYVDDVNEVGMDIFVSSVGYGNTEEPIICEEITWYQATCNRLTDKQIEAINQKGELPPGAKFIKTIDGRFVIVKDPINARQGSRKLPVGYEVRKDLLGFTHVLPVDTEGPFIKNK